MSEKEFLGRLGFGANPFQFTNADEEEHLQSYFVPPPYFDSVWGDPTSPKSHVIFAPRGGGKSAQRKMIEYKSQDSDVFVLRYDRFEHLSTSDLKELTVDYHLRNIVSLLLLGFLLEFRQRGVHASAFSRVEREQIEALCDYYLGRITRFEAVRASEALRTLSSKAKQFLKDWSGPLNALAAAALSSQGIGVGKIDSIQQSAGQTVEGPAKAHLEVVRDLLRSIGFGSIYILIDKVDETPQTGNNAEASFMLVKPLLRDLELLQIKDIAFKFFLWDNLKTYYGKFGRPDRLQQFELRWDEEHINRMLSKRLEAFSGEKVRNLSQLTNADLAEPLQKVVVLFASGSPRDMIRVCQDIISEQLQINPGSDQIGLEAIVKGISTFSSRRANELLQAQPQVLRELIKVGQVNFTANYVANDVFKIDANAARNKIRGWVDAGVVEKIGELSSGGRPIYHYAVSDIRIAKAMLAQLDLIQFIKQKTRVCPKCRALLIRDWDTHPAQSCHQCSSAFLLQSTASSA